MKNRKLLGSGWMMKLKLLHSASNKGIMGRKFRFYTKGVKVACRIYTFVTGYWWKLLLWEALDAWTEGKQHRSPGGPAPAQTLPWLPPPLRHLPSTSAGKASFLWLREAVKSLKGFFCFSPTQSPALLTCGVYSYKTSHHALGAGAFCSSWLKSR